MLFMRGQPLILSAAHANIIEAYGTPEMFADGAVFFDRGELVEIIVFANRFAEQEIERHECGRIRMLKSAFGQSVMTAMATWQSWLGPEH